MGSAGPPLTQVGAVASALPDALTQRLRAVDRWASGVVRRHWPVLLVLAVGALLRLAVQLAYQPVLWFFGDSFAYLVVALHLAPYEVRPIG